jgi:uncharacterized protein (DUF983 family)
MILSPNLTEATKPEKKPGFLKLLACKCPRCRRGNMFVDNNPWNLKHTMKMHKHCGECGQPLNIEVGFYYGASYVAYALSVAFSVATFVAWYLFIGFSLSDDRLFYWLTINAVLMIFMQPYFMRLARTGWLAIFTKYDANWKIHPPKDPERVNETQESNW